LEKKRTTNQTITDKTNDGGGKWNGEQKAKIMKDTLVYSLCTYVHYSKLQ
jgi:hypothetical protein